MHSRARERQSTTMYAFYSHARTVTQYHATMAALCFGYKLAIVDYRREPFDPFLEARNPRRTATVSSWREDYN